MNQFANNLKKLRKAKGLTQVKLADDLLITNKIIGSYEEGRGAPTYDRLITIADYFEVSIDDLLKK